MNTQRNAGYGWIGGLVMLLFSSTSSAALVSYEITGDVIFATGFGLSAGDTITASGVLDDSLIAGGTIAFGSGSNNTMTIAVGTATFTESMDPGFAGGSFPQLVFSSSVLTEVNYTALSGQGGAPADFSSNFLTFGSGSVLAGQWNPGSFTTAPVPLPAAVWLFGTGLLGFAGVARRRETR
jgi:hypothetical protein